MFMRKNSLKIFSSKWPVSLGGGKKSKSWNLIRLTSLSHSLCSTDSENTKMSSEDPWEVLALDGSIKYQNEAKIQRKWP